MSITQRQHRKYAQMYQDHKKSEDGYGFKRGSQKRKYNISIPTERVKSDCKGRSCCQEELIKLDGAYPFLVVADSEHIRIRVQFSGIEMGFASGHTLLFSPEEKIAYAGELVFSKGVLQRWNNASGTFGFPAENAWQANLPMECFWACCPIRLQTCVVRDYVEANNMYFAPYYNVLAKLPVRESTAGAANSSVSATELPCTGRFVVAPTGAGKSYYVTHNDDAEWIDQDSVLLALGVDTHNADDPHVQNLAHEHTIQLKSAGAKILGFVWFDAEGIDAFVLPFEDTIRDNLSSKEEVFPDDWFDCNVKQQLELMQELAHKHQIPIYSSFDELEHMC